MLSGLEKNCLWKGRGLRVWKKAGASIKLELAMIGVFGVTGLHLHSVVLFP